MFLILVYVTCLLIILSATMVVMSRNALHSILFLVFSFFFSSFTIFFLENEFLALFFLIIYLGAIMILFLFVVMMLDLKHNTLKINRLHLPTGVTIGFICFLLISNSVLELFSNSSSLSIEQNFYVNWQLFLEQTSEISVIGDTLYQHFVVQILIAGLLLYTTTIGVVFLTSTKHKNASIKSTQSLTRQLSRHSIL